jgi:hypothetical protein
MTQSQDKYVVRLPDGMRDEIAEAAKANGRSMNAEIIARIAGNTERLRDEFAMAALTGLCGNSVGPYQASASSGWTLVNCSHLDVARQAYTLADAMLEARKAGGSNG